MTTQRCLLWVSHGIQIADDPALVSPRATSWDNRRVEFLLPAQSSAALNLAVDSKNLIRRNWDGRDRRAVPFARNQQGKSQEDRFPRRGAAPGSGVTTRESAYASLSRTDLGL